MRCLLLLVFLLSTAAARSTNFGVRDEQTPLKIKIVHANDVHAHIEQSSVSLTRCRSEDEQIKQCVGGAPRMYTKIKELVDMDPDHTLVLNAGDYFQGTIWYTLFKYKPVVEFANIMNYSAMALGNHEFDDSMAGLEPFINGAEFPLLAANIDGSNWPNWDRLVKKSIIKEIDGVKIGIIGYVTQDTAFISKPDSQLAFLDVIESVSKEAHRLKEQESVNILIALGHAGYDIDQKMAAAIPELDVIVGGHSHTFLFTGDNPPSIEKPLGPYPTYVKQNDSERVVPVVQAYCYSKYLGYLELQFGSDGELLEPVQGKGVSQAEVILLDHSVKQEESVLNAMLKYRDDMAYFITPIGSLIADLTPNWIGESSIGNFIADAMLDAWGGQAQFAFINSGGIRTGLRAGALTGEDIFSVIPFNNTIDRVTIRGADIKTVLENFASGFCADGSCYAKTFLQVSGLKIVYRIRNDNVGSRIESIQTPCEGYKPNQDQSMVEWCPLEDDKNYSVVMISFLAEGGSRTCNFDCYIKDREIGPRDYACAIEYVSKHSPIRTKVEGRVTLIFDPSNSTNPQPPSKIPVVSCPKRMK